MTKPNTLVLTGYGINCDEETKFAFEKAGAKADIVHINDLIETPKRLDDYQIVAFPGGFSYGDDTGAGNALANKVRNHLLEEFGDFVKKDKLVIGICNGFQVLTNLGLLPAFNEKYGYRNVALVHNNSTRYQCEWIDIEFNGKSPWTKDIGRISLPIAHGEGKFFTDRNTLKKLNEKSLVAAKYIRGEIFNLYKKTEYNPNGSLDDIAGITDESGRILGMMPHPERAIDFTHLPHWTLLKEKYKRAGREIPDEASGIIIFKNGVKYFK
ncbi:MAG: phosphoribosylformylglycinamidine synthase I [Nanoarchaeota archaeon]